METSIALFALLAAVSVAGKGAPTQKSLDAYLRYTGADVSINNAAKGIQKSAESQVPDEARIYLASGVYVGKTLIDKKVVFTLTFP